MPAGGDRVRIDIGQTKRFANGISQQREADKTGARTPLKDTLLPGHSEGLEEREKVLSKARSAAIKFFPIADVDAAKSDVTRRAQLSQSRPEVAMLETF